MSIVRATTLIESARAVADEIDSHHPGMDGFLPGQPDRVDGLLDSDISGADDAAGALAILAARELGDAPGRPAELAALLSGNVHEIASELPARDERHT